MNGVLTAAGLQKVIDVLWAVSPPRLPQVRFFPNRFVQEFDDEGKRVAFYLASYDIYFVHPNNAEIFRNELHGYAVEISREELIPDHQFEFIHSYRFSDDD